MRRAGWAEQAAALLRKDLRAELRTRTALSSIGLFTLASLLLLAMATDSLRNEVITDARGVVHPAWDDPARMGMLWVLLCFAAFAGLSHSFVHEEETGTAVALRLHMRPEAVYTAKLLFNCLTLLAIALVITPAYMLIINLQVGNPIDFLGVMFGGILGLGACATILAALTSRARSVGALYGAVGLPILVVFLILLMNAARTLYIRDASALSFVKDTGGLISFGILIIALSALLFHFVWEET